MDKNQLFANLKPVKNVSGGSGAETWVLQDKDNSFFVRKFANGDAGRKLLAQTQWLKEFKDKVYCPQVIKDGTLGDYYFYDMTYLTPSETGFQKLQTGDYQNSVITIIKALTEFNSIFEQLKPVVNSANRESYIQGKFLNTIETSKNKDSMFAKLADASLIVINGKNYTGLRQILNHAVVKKTISHILSEKLYSVGHGDLTLSNLVVQEDAVAFIDPNPNFELISHEQEYSKILQSTVVKYELFNDLAVTFDGVQSISYDCSPVRDFTAVNEMILHSEPFKNLNLDSLFFHLAIHLARILPYVKTENKNKSYVYLAEIIKLLNAVSTGQHNLS